MHVFKHPKYYKELRKRNKSDQAISLIKPDGENVSVRPGPGLKLQAREDSTANSTRGQVAEPQASSSKPQAASKPEPVQVQASSNKRQAWNPEAQASSVKPQAASSLILDPRNMDIGEVLGGKGPRAFASMKVLCGCFTWKAIWWGLNWILLPLVTFNSKVQKYPEVLQTNRSGVPSKLMFSILISEKDLKFCLTFWYNLASGPICFLR